MEKALYADIQRSFDHICELFSSRVESTDIRGTIDSLQKEKDQLQATANDQDRLLIYCIETLLKLVQEGDRKKIFAFADAVHDTPKIGQFVWNELYFVPKFRAFQSIYGDHYFADILQEVEDRTYDIADICRIDDRYLYYRGKQGEKRTLDLKACAGRYALVTGRCGKESIKCVGTRLFANTAFYALYAEKPVYFCMNLKHSKWITFLEKYMQINMHSKEFSAYYAVQKSLVANGYTTLDLN